MSGFKQTFQSGLAEVGAVAKDELGDIRWEGNKCYKYVQYKATAIACVAGCMVGYYSVDGYKSNQVTMDTSDQIQAATLMAAGITQAVIPTDGYGWIQIKGFATMSCVIIGSADGDPISMVGATADTGDVDKAAGGVDHACGWVADDSDNEICVDCPF